LAHQILCESVLKEALTGINYDFYRIYYSARVIEEIKESGIDVISYSLGGLCNIHQDINNLVTEYGVTICAGIGNDNQEGRFVGWSAPENTIAVGGQDWSYPNRRWPDSNYGRTSDKGVSIVANVAPFSYGTSFSAPRAAGTVVKMLIINPNVTPFNIRYILHETATKIGDYEYDDIPHEGWEPGWNNEVGYGALNDQDAIDMCGSYN
jgi:serine protease